MPCALSSGHRLIDDHAARAQAHVPERSCDKMVRRLAATSHAAVEDLSTGRAELRSLGLHAGRDLRLVRDGVGTERLGIAVAGMFSLGAKCGLVAAQPRLRRTRARQDCSRAKDGKGGLHR